MAGVPGNRPDQLDRVTNLFCSPPDLDVVGGNLMETNPVGNDLAHYLDKPGVAS